MRVVAARELKNRTGEVLRRVRAGEVVVVTVRGMRVARLVPVESSRLRRTAPDRRSRYAAIRAVAGKYRGMGTVEAFLREKKLEIARER